MEKLASIARRADEICQLNLELNYKEVLAFLLNKFEIRMDEYDVKIEDNADSSDGISFISKESCLYILPCYPAENSNWQPMALSACLVLTPCEDEYPLKYGVLAKWRRGETKWFFKTDKIRQEKMELILRIKKIIN